MRLHIGNLTEATTAEELMELTKPFGVATSASIVTDRVTGISRGYGFIVFESDDAVAKATEGLKGQSLNGQAIRVG